MKPNRAQRRMLASNTAPDPTDRYLRRTHGRRAALKARLRDIAAANHREIEEAGIAGKYLHAGAKRRRWQIEAEAAMAVEFAIARAA